MDIIQFIKDNYSGSKEWRKNLTLYKLEVENQAEKGDPLYQKEKKRIDYYDSVVNDPTTPSFIAEATNIGLDFHLFRLDKFSNLVSYVSEENNKLRIDYLRLSRDLAFYYCVITFKGVIYVYDKSGMFVEGELRLKKQIERVLGEYSTVHRVKEVIERIKIISGVEEFPFNRHRDLIPLKNGVYDTNTSRLYPHSPAYGFTYSLPVNYDPDAQCPRIEKFFKEVLKEEDIPLIEELIGYCLIPTNKYHKAFMFVGDGSNGKSTMLNLITAFLGKDNTSNVPLQNFSKDKFSASELVGKIANICADIPAYPMKYTGIFKMLVGEDSIYAERKFKDPFKYVNTAKLIFSANETPEVSDDTYAFWRRWVIIEFPNSFKDKANPDLINELTTDEELSGLLNKALAGLERLLIRNKFSTSDNAEKMMNEWKKRSNTVYAFVMDCIEQEPDNFELKDEVYSAYVGYCDVNDLVAVNKSVFARELQRFIKVIEQRPTVEGRRVRVWAGIRLKGREQHEDQHSENSETLDLSGFAYE